MEPVLPEYLYKYTKVDQNFINMLAERKLRFSSPLAFNDPFDWKLYEKHEINLEDLETYFLSLNPSFYKNKFDVEDKQAAIIWAKYHFMQAIQKSVNQLGVCCFSTDENNLLLWAHYADCHKGACIKFKTKELLKIFDSIKYVQYSESFPKVEIFKDFISALNIAPLHKSIDWSYEKEVRVITKEAGYFNFPSEAIEQIRFGVKCEYEALPKDILREFKRSANKNFKYILSTQSRESYKVVPGAEWGF